METWLGLLLTAYRKSPAPYLMLPSPTPYDIRDRRRRWTDDRRHIVPQTLYSIAVARQTSIFLPYWTASHFRSLFTMVKVAAAEENKDAATIG